LSRREYRSGGASEWRQWRLAALLAKTRKSAGSGSSGGAVPVAIAKTNELGGNEGAPEPALPRRMIEIETAGARVHVPEGVDARTLSVVLAALRRTS
jgi:hypothetical protein